MSQLLDSEFFGSYLGLEKKDSFLNSIQFMDLNAKTEQKELNICHYQCECRLHLEQLGEN